MFDDSTIRRLAETVTPDAGTRSRLRDRIRRSIEPTVLKNTVESVTPSPAFQRSLKTRLLQSLGISPVADDVRDLAKTVNMPAASFAVLRQRILSQLAPVVRPTFVHSGLKWGAAFAVFVLLLRAMPLVLLAPATRADTGVQLIPSGKDVAVFTNNAWHTLDHSEILKGPILIRTGEDSSATVIFSNDGVFRLAANTTFKLQEIGDRNDSVSTGPTATLVRGDLWILGLLPPVTDGISVQTSHGTVSVNAGSVGVSDDGQNATISVYDRGATLQFGNQTSFLVAGEQGIGRSSQPFTILTMQTRVFAEKNVAGNLQQDAVHRAEIAKLQQERRARMAGILPTSILYPAKRIAEEVDVLFTLSQDGRNEKRIQQADTRLSEALTLIKEGQNTQAAVPLTEYRDSLISMASGTGDNLVRYLIRKQIADASSSLTPDASPGTKVALVQSAILDVSAAIPDAALNTKDIEGYVLVDKLTEINRTLTVAHNLTGALVAYAEVSPYLKSLLAEKDGTHPLLQKEARQLLVSTSSLIREASRGSSDKTVVAAQIDINQYLPPEPESVLDLEKRLNAQVQEMKRQILIFSSPMSRYNHLQYLMSELKLRKDPNRGTLLRRLYRELPADGIGGYVLTEIKNLGDELRGN